MRTTLDIDEKLLNEAQHLAKTKTKKELIHLSLQALIREKRRERLLKKIGAYPIDLTPEKLRRIRRAG